LLGCLSGTLLQLDITEVPHFYGDKDGDRDQQEQHLKHWLADRGLGMSRFGYNLETDYQKAHGIEYNEIVILGGPPRPFNGYARRFTYSESFKAEFNKQMRYSRFSKAQKRQLVQLSQWSRIRRLSSVELRQLKRLRSLVRTNCFVQPT
jgi:hypothetical protein